MSAALALAPEQQLVASWRTGVLSLPDDRVPCPGMIWREAGPKGRFGVWAGVRTMMFRFLDHWGEEAAAIGWSTKSLFGVHYRAGAERADCTGALVTTLPREVIAMTELAITLERNGSRGSYRRVKDPVESFPIWEYRYHALKE